MLLHNSENLEFDNPYFGHDIGQIWAAIDTDRTHPAYEVLWRDISHFSMLWRSMLRCFGESVVDSADFPFDDEEADEYVHDVVRAIGSKVEIEHDITSWSDEGQEEADLVEAAIHSGLRFGFLLADEKTRRAFG